MNVCIMSLKICAEQWLPTENIYAFPVCRQSVVYINCTPLSMEILLTVSETVLKLVGRLHDVEGTLAKLVMDLCLAHTLHYFQHNDANAVAV